LTGATLIATISSGVASLMHQGIRTYRINNNVLSGINISAGIQSDYATSTQFTTTFNTSVDNYILFSIQLNNAADSSVVQMVRAIKSV
jgi:phosphoenolpyruvate synthase/pyruvate phosphate dikinase